MEEIKASPHFQYHYEEDQKFIRKIHLKKLLEDLVKDVIEEKPENIYAFMEEWAAKEREKVKGDVPY